MPTKMFDPGGRAERRPGDPPDLKFTDRTRATVPADWKPPNLQEPPTWPMSHADFAYRFGYFDREEYQRLIDKWGLPEGAALLHSLTLSIKKDRELEGTAQPWKGMWFYDEVREYENGMRPPSSFGPDGEEKVPPYVMQDGLWYPVDMWNELSQKRASLASDRPEAPPHFNLADTFLVQYALSIDTPATTREPAKGGLGLLGDAVNRGDQKVHDFFEAAKAKGAAKSTGLGPSLVPSLDKGMEQQGNDEYTPRPLPPAPATPRFGRGLGLNYDFSRGSTDLQFSLGATVLEETQSYSFNVQALQSSSFDIKVLSFSPWGRLTLRF